MTAIMPRFVLLRHECPPPSKKPKHEKPSHWDFMLESGGVLRTWELRELPAAWAELLGKTSTSTTVAAVPLPDHRLDYLDYEGPLSGDRGSVRRCDRGTYELLEETPDHLLVQLEGELLGGTAHLTLQGPPFTLECGAHASFP